MLVQEHHRPKVSGFDCRQQKCKLTSPFLGGFWEEVSDYGVLKFSGMFFLFLWAPEWQMPWQVSDLILSEVKHKLGDFRGATSENKAWDMKLSLGSEKGRVYCFTLSFKRDSCLCR